MPFTQQEMYCDTLPLKPWKPDNDPDHKPDHMPHHKPDQEAAPFEAPAAPIDAPRLTVYSALVEALKEHKSRVKSITVTGHSLGGALASLCGFDLSLALAEAAPGGEDSHVEEAAKNAPAIIFIDELDG